MLLCGCVCNFLAIALNSFAFGGGLILFLIFSAFIIAYEYLFGGGSEHILTLRFHQVLSLHAFDIYAKELSTLLFAKSTPSLHLSDIKRKDEVMIRGYMGEHDLLCCAPLECPLGVALRTNRATLEAIDRTQHTYKSLPVLVAHAERLYEQYLER